MNDAKSSNVVELIGRVKQMLDQGQPTAAWALLQSCGSEQPTIRNARGVCLMRMGQLSAALTIFRELNFPGGCFAIPDQTPTIFRTNYVCVLLMMGDLMVAMALLYHINDRNHPAVVELQGTVRKWKESLTLWQRAGMWIGNYPEMPVVPTFPPGRLWLPGDREIDPPNQDPRPLAA